jgi:hypothetical protein
MAFYTRLNRTGRSVSLNCYRRGLALIKLIDVIGWAGAVAIVLAYALVSAKKVQGDSGKYQTLNIVGSVCLTAYTLYYSAYASTVVNVVWTVIGVYAIRKKLWAVRI